MKSRILILGGGGHAKVLIDLISRLGIYRIEGVLDANLKKEDSVLGFPVLGDDSLMQALYRDGLSNVCLGVGKVGVSNVRRDIYEKTKSIGFSVPALVHPQSVVSGSAVLSEGVQIMAGVVIQADSFLDKNVIVNTSALIDHDCNIASYVHISPGAVVGGGCLIGENSFIGAGATLIHGVKVGKNVVVGAGAVVIDDIDDDKVVKGVPAR